MVSCYVAGGDGQPFVGKIITMKYGDYTRRVGINGTAEAIKEAKRFYAQTHYKNRARSCDCYAVNNVSIERPSSVDQEQHLHGELSSVGARVHSNSSHPSEEENQRLLQEVWLVMSQTLTLAAFVRPCGARLFAFRSKKAIILSICIR